MLTVFGRIRPFRLIWLGGNSLWGGRPIKKRGSLPIVFSEAAEFDVCAASFTPIYSGSQSATCPFDGVKYQSKYKGSICTVCQVAEIGAPASGLRLMG